MSHVNNMMEDQYDYYLYGMRKFTLTAIDGLCNVTNSEIHRYNHVVKSAIGLCKLVHKVKKVDQAHKDAHKKELDEWMASDSYKDLQKQLADITEDDDDSK